VTRRGHLRTGSGISRLDVRVEEQEQEVWLAGSTDVQLAEATDH